MALSASTIFEINSAASGSNVNSGGFNTANANFIADGVIASGTGNSPTLSSATYSFVDGDNGHWIYFKAQANITEGWYQIASQSSGVATLKAAVGEAIQITNNRFITNTVAGVGSASPSSVTFGVDYSQSTSHRYTGTDLTGTTTACTSASTPFTAQMVGNLIHLNSGTGVTAGWYEIVSVSVVTATLDRSAGATYSATTYHTGGALSLGSSDDAVFELAASSSSAASRYFIKGSGTYTLGGTVSNSVIGNALWPIIFEGYKTTRGDRPTVEADQPLIDSGSTVLGWSAGNVEIWCIRGTGTVTTSGNGVWAPAGSGGGRTGVFNCFIRNTGTGTACGCINISGGFGPIVNCYLYNPKGRGVTQPTAGSSTAGIFITGCHIVATQGIVSLNVNSQNVIINNIFEGCLTSGIETPNTNMAVIYGNTFYGTESKMGTAIIIATGADNTSVMNNIFYGLTTGVNMADTTVANYDDYNCYFNNTNNVSAATQWQIGQHTVALTPSFTSMTERSGTTATTTSGNHLVQTGATFQTWGITPGRDVLRIVSGTGVTAALYGIASVDSETQITTVTALTANATADKSWQITQGHNMGVGTNMRGAGNPGTFYPAGETVGYLDIGAAQRLEPVGVTSLSRVMTGM